MALRRADLVLVVFAWLGSACSSEDAPAVNGTPTGGASPNPGAAGASAQNGGASATAGSPNNGNGGAAAGAGSQAGGNPTGGAAEAGGPSGGGHAGSSTGGASGGAAGGSAAGAGGAAGGGSMGSDGCNQAPTLQNGTITLMVDNAARKYILRVPDGYDNKHAYRLVFAYAWSGASASQVVSSNYFTFATLDSKNTIFVAPEAANGAGSWSKGDVAFTDAILKQLQDGLCIDKSRIFASGFSFGGAMSLAIACTRADVFRGVAFFSGADLTGSCTGTLTKPIAYYASQASQDSTGAPMPSSGRIKQAEFAAVNGCTAEPSSTTFPASGQAHTCTDYKGCSAGHPTKYCVFDGPHGWEPKDPGQATSWNAPEAWKFITQF